MREERGEIGEREEWEKSEREEWEKSERESEERTPRSRLKVDPCLQRHILQSL